MSDPNTFEAVGKRLHKNATVRGNICSTCLVVFEDELAALAPHYVSKSKVRELLKEVASQRPVSKWKLVWLARALTALLEEAGR